MNSKFLLSKGLDSDLVEELADMGDAVLEGVCLLSGHTDMSLKGAARATVACWWNYFSSEDEWSQCLAEEIEGRLPSRRVPLDGVEKFIDSAAWLRQLEHDGQFVVIRHEGGLWVWKKHPLFFDEGPHRG